MDIKEFSKENHISLPSIFKYYSNLPVNYNVKKILKNVKKEDLDNYDKYYQQWYIKEHFNDFKELSKKSHISVTNWIKYVNRWNVSKNVKYRIEKYIQENKINIDKNGEVILSLDEKQYKGENYIIYLWNIDIPNIRRLQIEIKDDHVLVKKKKELLSLIEDYIERVFAWVYRFDGYGIIVDVKKENEDKIVEIIDRKYK